MQAALLFLGITCVVVPFGAFVGIGLSLYLGVCRPLPHLAVKGAFFTHRAAVNRRAAAPLVGNREGGRSAAVNHFPRAAARDAAAA